MESAVRSPWIKSAITTGRARNDALLALPRLPKFPAADRHWPSKPCREERNFWMQRLEAKNRPERPQGSPETERVERYRRKSPQKRPIGSRRRDLRFRRTGWWCAQSYANPSQRRFHTGNRGNPLFSAFFSQNGEFKSKGFRFPCVLSVGFRAM